MQEAHFQYLTTLTFYGKSRAKATVEQDTLEIKVIFMIIIGK